MSHQYEPYWFPECILCQMGNLPTVICLRNSCHEVHGLKKIEDERDLEVEQDGHYWKGCHFCEDKILADPAAWGSLGICADCWNLYVDAGRTPPTTAAQIVAEVESGKLELRYDPSTNTKVRVLP